MPRRSSGKQLASSAQAAQLSSGTPGVLWARLDGQERYLSASRAYASHLDSTPSGLCGQKMDSKLGASDYAKLLPHIARVLQGEEVSVELELSAPLGGSRQVVVTLSPEIDAENKLQGFVVVELDITDSKKLEHALFQRERGFKTIVENSPDIVARLDRDARHLFINRAVQAPFGLPPARFIGSTMAELDFPASVADAYAQATADVFALKRERAFDFVLPVAGHTRHYTARAIPELDRAGAVESVLVVTYDVTTRTEAQLERDALLVREKAARMQGEAAARARDEFLAIVSHELRSPLNGIQSWTHVLENYVGADSPPVARALAGIKLGVQHQVRLIEDLVDSTLIMTGKLKLAREAVRLNAVVNAAVESVQALADEKKITLETVLDANPPRLVGDARRIQQIIWNLLTNAIKFTQEGGRVRVEVVQEAGEVSIVVRDSGRGIAAEFLPFLFDPFRQADGSTTRRTGGIGLGLTLVRRLTELHGGRVMAESDGENQGAKFSISLPLNPGEPLETPAQPTVKLSSQQALSSLRERQIVVIDDQREARDSLTELLDQAGAQVYSFGSGVDAVQHFRGITAWERPDVLICDIAMPEQDGYVTLQQIREVEKLQPREGRGETPAIALTAFSQREDKLKALANGFQVHLAKPVDPAELIGVIDALTRTAD